MWVGTITSLLQVLLPQCFESLIDTHSPLQSSQKSGICLVVDLQYCAMQICMHPTGYVVRSNLSTAGNDLVRQGCGCSKGYSRIRTRFSAGSEFILRSKMAPNFNIAESVRT